MPNDQQSNESSDILKIVRLVQRVKHKQDTSSAEETLLPLSPVGVASSSTSGSSLSSGTESGKSEGDLPSLIQLFMDSQDGPKSTLALVTLIDSLGRRATSEQLDSFHLKHLATSKSIFKEKVTNTTIEYEDAERWGQQSRHCSEGMAGIIADVLLYSGSVHSFWFEPDGSRSDPPQEGSDQVEAAEQGSAPVPSILWPADAERFLEEHSVDMLAAAKLAQVLQVFPYILSRAIVASLHQPLQYPAGHSCWAVFVDSVSTAVQRFAQSLANNSELPVSVYLGRACPITTISASVTDSSGRSESHARSPTSHQMKLDTNHRPSSPRGCSPPDASFAIGEELSSMSMTTAETTAVSRSSFLPCKSYTSQMSYDMERVNAGQPGCKLRSSLHVQFVRVSEGIRPRRQLLLTCVQQEDPSQINILCEIALRQDAQKFKVLDIWYREKLELETGNFKSDPSMQEDEILVKETAGRSDGKSLGATVNLGVKPSVAVNARGDTAHTSASETQRTRPYTLSNELEDLDERKYYISPTTSAPTNWIVPNIPIMSTFKNRQKKAVPATFTTQAQILLQPQMEKCHQSAIGYLLINQLHIEDCCDFSGLRDNIVQADYFQHDTWKLRVKDTPATSTNTPGVPNVVEGSLIAMHGVGEFNDSPHQFASKFQRKAKSDLKPKPKFYAGAKWDVAQGVVNRIPLFEYSISDALLDPELRA